MREAEVAVIVSGIGFVPIGIYGLLNMVVPQLTVRWQRRATAAHPSDPRGSIGTAFNRVLMPSEHGYTRVRLFGLAELLVSTGWVVVVVRTLA